MAHPKSVRVLRLPAGDEQLHLIKLELMQNTTPGWDNPAPNLLVFWGQEGWAQREALTFPVKNHQYSVWTVYQTTWRGKRQQLPLNQYCSYPKNTQYGDVFLVSVRTDWSEEEYTLEYVDIPRSFMESTFVKESIEHYKSFGGEDDDAGWIVRECCWDFGLVGITQLMKGMLDIEGVESLLNSYSRDENGTYQPGRNQ